MDRRRFLGYGAGVFFGGLFATQEKALAAGIRALALNNLHTGEKLKVTYWADGQYIPSCCREISHLLRDHRSGEQAEMSGQLFDLLYELKSSLGTSNPFEVISGYRSPATNAALARASGGVASNSMHTQGKAIDVRVAGVQLAHLRDAALSLKAGGVGFYPKSNFVHLDVGRVRRW